MSKEKRLLNACKRGDIKIVKSLLKTKLNFDIKDKALTYAAHYEHLEIVNLLIQYGAIKDEDINDALIWASNFGLTSTVKILLDKGADVHARDDEALIFAVKNNNIKTVKVLLDNGADIHARKNEIPDIIFIWNYTNMCDFLINYYGLKK